MISEGINIRALGDGAPTAEQERLRAAREVEKIQRLISNNVANWERFAMTNIYMLQGVDSKFLELPIDIDKVLPKDWQSQLK